MIFRDSEFQELSVDFNSNTFWKFVHSVMQSEVPKSSGGQMNPVAFSHYEIGNEIYMPNVNRKIFTCQRLHNTTNVKSSRALAITDHQLIEMAVNPFKIGFGTVLEVHYLEGLLKIKFKKITAGLLTLTFRSGHILQFVMVDPIAFVDFLKGKMQLIGIKGDVTNNPTNTKHIESATSFYSATRETEAQFSLNPSYKLIEKIMDLLREAVEQFAEGGDDRYLAVIDHIQKFLQRADVTAILDLTVNHPVSSVNPNDVTGATSHENGKRIDVELSQPSKSLMYGESLVHVELLPVVDSEEEQEGVTTNIPQVNLSQLLFSESPPLDLQPTEDIMQTEIKQEENCENELTKYEEELAELMMSSCSTIVQNDCSDVEAKKSDDLEYELKSMLGDITDEFADLLNSFEKNAGKT